MIDMSNDEEDEEESRRRLFLLRTLFGTDCDRKQAAAQHNEFANNQWNEVNRRKHTRITRIAQIDTWDCGIACLLMISQWLRDDKERDFGDVKSKRTLERKWLLSEVGTESIWTSDLMWQLQSWKTRRKPWWSFVAQGIFAGAGFQEEYKSNFNFVLASKQIIDADESYRNFQYYQKAFEEDQSRVASTFRYLCEQNVPMLQTVDQSSAKPGLSLSTVREIVEREDCVAIVLLDNNELLPGATSQNNALEADDATSKFNRLPYAGHYVILCGTSNDPKHVEIANAGEDTRGEGHFQEFCFVMCNPDSPSTTADSNYTFVTPQRLETAWRGEGTDDDIIFLRKIP
mmetsp:Transcript_13851/g.34800  ORF Transcript_13851/g.34800 Transcript_13851/m.34800 type:complete len:344 (-) Transcript_13851:182-1213(-)